jgi:hypothetical protein
VFFVFLHFFGFGGDREASVQNQSNQPIFTVFYLTWNVLLKILILEVLSRTAYSPSEAQTNLSADPKDLFLHASVV